VSNRTDTERLDWLENRAEKSVYGSDDCSIHVDELLDGRNLRDAIDAAMDKETT
jgi:hypothetical protein